MSNLRFSLWFALVLFGVGIFGLVLRGLSWRGNYVPIADTAQMLCARAAQDRFTDSVDPGLDVCGSQVGDELCVKYLDLDGRRIVLVVDGRNCGRGSVRIGWALAEGPGLSERCRASLQYSLPAHGLSWGQVEAELRADLESKGYSPLRDSPGN